MADQAIPLADVLPAVADATDASAARPDVAEPENKDSAARAAESGDAIKSESSNKQTPPAESATEDDKPAGKQDDADMKDTKTEDTDLGTEAPAASEAQASAPTDKSKARRKSGVPEHKAKKLNKKASKKALERMDNHDAQPGDYFYVRLKGFPLWPAIVCDNSMLPNTLLKNRPVTAEKEDGTYRADYADGGPKAKDRSFPVMYLHTNEFGWIPNYDLLPLNFEDVANVTPSMRKDLKAAHLLAAEQHGLDYFKDILQQFVEQKAAEVKAKEEAKAAKKAVDKANKAKPRKSLSKTVVDAEDEEDVEMEDLVVDQDEDEAADKPKKTKKRKAEEEAETPQRSESVKKPKTTIKLTNTPKANGTATPKSSKPKPKKATAKPKEPEVVVPQEPELTAEEKRVKKEKEILFLRHKLQKGLLTRDQEPKEDEMKQMSEYITKLEGYADLEVSIIRATKINKVLKAILKLPTIPKEEEFGFKTRSQTLLDKWNKLLLSENGVEGAIASGTNGGVVKPLTGNAKISPVLEATNGVKDLDMADEKTDEKSAKAEAITADTAAPSKESVEEESTPIESTA